MLMKNLVNPDPLSHPEYSFIRWFLTSVYKDLDLDSIEEVWCERKGRDIITTLEGMSMLPNVKELRLRDNALMSFEGLEKNVNLIRIYSSSNDIISLKGTENLTQLKLLNLMSNSLTNLNGIENLTSLEKLYCNNNELVSIKGIESLPNLNVFTCNENDELTPRECVRIPFLQLRGLEWYNIIPSLKGMDLEQIKTHLKDTVNKSYKAFNESYTKTYEGSEEEKEDIIRSQFYYLDECEKMFYKIVDKFGVKNLNGDETSDENAEGNLRIQNGTIEYSVRGMGIYDLIGKRDYEKFFLKGEDGYITFGMYIHENIIYLRKPVDEVIRRRGFTKKQTRFFSNRKYKIFTFNGTDRKSVV